MELRQLKNFCTVAREMHVTKAAALLRIAQPALTKQMRALERDLGCPLMCKTGRGISLTQAGQFLFTESESILQAIESMALRVKAIGSGNAGHLAIGISEAAAFEPKLARAFDTFRRHWPEVVLTFVQRQSIDLPVAIAKGEIDLAFTCPVAATNPGLHLQTLARHEMVLAVPASHPFAKQKKVALENLKNEGLILVSHGRVPRSFEETLAATCGGLGFAPRFVQAVPDLILALNLVATGVGSAFAPDYMDSIRNEAIAYVRVESPVPLQAELVVLTCEEEWTSPLVKNLARTAVKAFKQRA